VPSPMTGTTFPDEGMARVSIPACAGLSALGFPVAIMLAIPAPIRCSAARRFILTGWTLNTLSRKHPSKQRRR